MSKKSKTSKQSTKPPVGAPLTRHRIDRSYRVFNLTEQDRETVLMLGQKSDGLPRHEVLSALVTVLDGLDLTDVAPRKTRAARLDIPDALLTRLQERSKESGVTMTRLLVMSAYAYLASKPEQLHSNTPAQPKKRGRKAKAVAGE